MLDNITTTLAADLTDFIWIGIVVVSIVGSMIGNVLKQQKEKRDREVGGSEELEEMAARRREQLRQATRQRGQPQAQAPQTGGTASGEPGNLTMAERIARARAKAQYQQRGQSSGRSAEQAQAQAQAQLQRRQRMAQAQQQQQAQQQARQRAQQQARLRAQQQAQQRARQQRAQAHAQVQAKARQQGTLLHDQLPSQQQPASQPTRTVRSPRRVKPRPAPVPASAIIGRDTGRVLSHANLRQAVILKEILDKPLALRQ